MRRQTASLALATLLAGCATIQPDRARWAEQSTPVDQTVVPILSLSSTATQPAAATKVKDLPERAEAAYIEALAAKTKSADELRAALSGTIAPAKASDGDLTKLPRTIAIGLGRQGFEDGQRYLAIDVLIVPIGFEFSDYAQLASVYESVNLETVSVQTTTDAKVEVAPKAGALSALDASYDRGTTNGTTFTDQGKIEVVSPDFQRDHLGLRLHSAANEDLTGTILISAAVHPSGTAETYVEQLKGLGMAPDALGPVPDDQLVLKAVVADSKLVDAAGRDLRPAKASVTTVTDRVWKARTLYVCAAVRYTERVPQGVSGRFYDEGKQIITERSFDQQAHIYPLVPADEVAPPLWGLYDAGGSAIEIDTLTKPQPITFSDDVAASRFAFWLARTKATTVGTQHLYALGPDGRLQPLIAAATRSIVVQRLSPEGDKEPPFYGAGPTANQDCTIPGRVPTVGNPLSKTASLAEKPVPGK